ncbi:type III PLP-dependent enzyme, partial [bacterium]|nr:type III PLP-dependent enzyme [bacterium]
MKVVEHLYRRWKALLPKVTPYYAVKCNPDKELVRILAENGANFDCASIAEIRHVLSFGIDGSRILYAHPCKRMEDITTAYQLGVRATTFDSVGELEKLAKAAPDMQAILRFYANDPDAKCVLSNKFGAFEEEWESLLKCARDLQVTVTGASFHVGSGACNPKVFEQALEQAHRLRDLAKRYGFDLTCIDIGGGFTQSNFDEMSASIRKSL